MSKFLRRGHRGGRAGVVQHHGWRVLKPQWRGLQAARGRQQKGAEAGPERDELSCGAKAERTRNNSKTHLQAHTDYREKEMVLC
jgi:hypothetical protein